MSTRSKPRRRYFTLDVFTDAPLAGNALAVVMDSAGLDDAQMQAIAREFAVSETVFVAPPSDQRHRASLRIFTPGSELPFAGHPTIGTAALFAILDEKSGAFTLEEKAGLVACVVERQGESCAYARFRTPLLPERLPSAIDASLVARAIVLKPSDIDSHNEIEIWSAGTPVSLVPVATLAALENAGPTAEIRAAIAGTNIVFLYVKTGSKSFRARMFSPENGIPEDPATGGAAAAFAGLIFHQTPHDDGVHEYVVHQGVEVGRPSRIFIYLFVRAGKLESVEIAGSAIIISEGALRL